MKSALTLVAFVATCLAIGALGALVTAPAIASWYPTIAKPSFNPPNWIFGPVWTTLYVLMAIAAWLVWRRPAPPVTRTALLLFVLQLVLNSVWSLLFFGLHRIDLALIDIILLLASIIATTIAFYRHSLVAAWLLIPYLAWVSFATVLNFAIWRLN